MEFSANVTRMSHSHHIPSGRYWAFCPVQWRMRQLFPSCTGSNGAEQRPTRFFGVSVGWQSKSRAFSTGGKRRSRWRVLTALD